MKFNWWIYSLMGLFFLSLAGFWTLNKFSYNSNYIVGQQIDSLNGVYVFYNGDVDNVHGRNVSKDGYNLGQKYQCVEFVKRYYYEHLDHTMPDSYGHAKDFFDNSLDDGQKNIQRDLIQYTNPSQTKPQVDDLLIYKNSVFNKYGHVAIVAKVMNDEIEIIQQNPGTFNNTRETFSVDNKDGKWEIKNKRIVGWLRKN